MKVWNFNVGLSLHKLQNSGKSEVTGIHELKNKAVVTAGWGRKVNYFKLPEDQYHLSPEAGIEGLGHTEDIQCLEKCTANLIATCSYDGVIMLWQISKSSITPNLRINTTTAHPGVPSATERLLFLTNRCRIRGGSLVSSGVGGWIRFWNVYSGELAGMFQLDASCTTDLSVLALAANSEGDVLATGDSAGHISIWDISEFANSATGACGANTSHRPPLVQRWQGHAHGVTSLQIVEKRLTESDKASRPPAAGAANNRDGNTLTLILSASADKTARLWTEAGKLIGTFGQSEPWQICRPETYA